VTLLVPARFAGPPGVANGGWLAGLLADAAGNPLAATVTLRKPTPIDTPLGLEIRDGTATLTATDVVYAEATAALPRIDARAAVAWEVAEAAAATYVGLVRHPFPGCVVCGTRRDPAEALCLRPGRLEPDVVVAPWVPAAWTAGAGRTDGTVRPAAVWAALDCPSAWAIDDEGRAVVLGRISAHIDRLPAVGERHVVVGWVRERVSRRIAHCGSAVYDERGELLAVAATTWFAVDTATFAL
jgi:acyl-coenzyme A thioesterase PaaI-like protein